MRVCIIGDNSAPLDEGMKKVTAEILNVLQHRCNPIILNPLKVNTFSFWNRLIRFQPKIIHYIPGPTIQSFILLKALKFLTRAYTVISLTHPDPNLQVRFISKYLKPDLILSQSIHLEQKFQIAGSHTAYLPNGVDTRRFQPVSSEEKAFLRVKYGIPPDAYVLLHVGNTREERNLYELPSLVNNDCCVLIVGSTTVTGNQEYDKYLSKQGCIVWNHYIETIEEIYALSDCFIFPTINPIGAVDTPLSVLEAMACNLPVIITRFGALPRVFKPGRGLIFIETNDDIYIAVDHIRNNTDLIATREMVLNLSWEIIGDQLIDLYYSIALRTSPPALQI